jgi:putative alpha-1,2-mannosidase
MFSRRRFMQALSAAGCYGLLASKAGPAYGAALSAEDTLGEDLTRYVNIRIGTGGHGHTYPGASVPFGAVQLSPDTYTKGWTGAPDTMTRTARSWASAIRI